MKKTLAILLSVLMLAGTIIPAGAFSVSAAGGSENVDNNLEDDVGDGNTYSVIGSSKNIFWAEYDVDDTTTEMTYDPRVKLYKLMLYDVEPENEITMKVVKNHDLDALPDGNIVVTFDVISKCDVLVVFDAQKCEIDVLGEGISNKQIITVDPPIEQPSEPITSGSYTYKLNDNNEAIILEYKGKEKNVILPDTIDGHPVTEIYRVCLHNKNIISLTIPEGIKKLHTDICNSCENLKTVYFNAVECYSDAPNNSGFGYCGSVDEFIIGKSVTRIPHTLIPARITEIEIPASVTEIDDFAFNYRNMIKLTIPDTVTKIGVNSFSSCGKLEEVTIGEGITDIPENAFRLCRNLKNVKMSDNVETIGKTAFDNCEKLESIYFSSNLKSIGNSAFNACEKLKSVDLPGNLEQIGDNAFTNCVSLSKADLPESLQSLGAMAFYCTGLTETVIPGKIKTIPSYCFYGCTKLSNVLIPEGVETVGYSAFSRCSSLEEIKLPESLTEIGQYAFAECTALKKINIPDSVTIISEGCFNNCSSLYDINIAKNVTAVEANAFNGCVLIDYLPFSDKVYKIGQGALNTKWLDNQPDGLIMAHKVAYWYKGTMPADTVLSLPQDTIGIAEHAFQNKINMTGIEIPDSVFYIGKYAFYGCSNLQEVRIPNGIAEIEKYTFYKCASLTGFVIPNTVNIVCKNAFEGCSSLESITIPKSVTKLESDSLKDCKKLKTIYGHLNSYAERMFGKSNYYFFIPINDLGIPVESGDANGDAIVDILDAVLVQKYSADKVEMSDKQLIVADFNNDKNVDVLDAVAIQKYAAA